MAEKSESAGTLLDEDVLKLLECPVCLIYMTGPIMLCGRGHSICRRCKEHVPQCPVCTAKFTGGRNYIVEDLANKVLFPCENKEYGCTERIPKAEMKAHGLSCPFRIYRCSAGAHHTCQWAGRRSELFDHVAVNHSASCLCMTGPKRVRLERIHFEYKRHTCFLVSQYDELFWLHLICDIDRKSYIFIVQYIGPVGKASQFLYSFDFESDDGCHKLHYTDVTKKDVLDIDSIIESKLFLEISDAMSEYFVQSDNKVYITFNIVKKNPR